MKHIVETNDAIIPTLEIERICNLIYHWVENLRHGACIYGASRSGKTCTLEFIEANVQFIFGYKIPCLLLSMWEKDTDASSGKRFWFEFLDVMGHEEAYKGDGVDKRGRLIEYMIDKMIECDEKRFLLLIDEAQNLENKHFGLLKDLHNRLRMNKNKYKLITILVGHPSLRHKKENLAKKGRGDLVGRFMLCKDQFKGPHKSKDLKYICAQYDRLRWPNSKSPTYTQHFLPLAFENGWRLENVADRLWTMIIATLTDLGIKKIEDLPIEPFYAILRALLMQASIMDAADFEVSNQMLEQILSEFGIEQIVEHTAYQAA